MKIDTFELASLTTRVVGDGPVTCVLLHGFGAPGDDLVALAQYIRLPSPDLVRFVFPAAPIELGGLYGDARAWWRLDLERLERELSSGQERDRRSEVPDGLTDARTKLASWLTALEARYSFDMTKLVL